MPRAQFSLKTLLWVMVVVAAFFGGAKWGRRDLENAYLAQFEAWVRADSKARELQRELNELRHEHHIPPGSR